MREKNCIGTLNKYLQWYKLYFEMDHRIRKCSAVNFFQEQRQFKNWETITITALFTRDAKVQHIY